MPAPLDRSLNLSRTEKKIIGIWNCRFEIGVNGLRHLIGSRGLQPTVDMIDTP